MAESRDTMTMIATEVASGLQPLEQAFSSLERFQFFLKALGWNGDLVGALPGGISQLVNGISGLSLNLQEIISKMEADEAVPKDKVLALLGSVKQVAEGIHGLKNISGLPAQLTSANFLQIFPRQVLDYLLSNYLLQHQPRMGHLLAVLGLIRISYVQGTGARSDHFYYQMAFEDLPKLLKEPTVLFQNAYGWGTDDFDSSMLFTHLQNLFLAYGTSLTLERIPLAKLSAFGIPDDANAVQPLALKAAIFDYMDGGAALTAGVGLFPLDKAGSSKPGLVLLPFARGEFKTEMEIAEQLFFQTVTALSVDGGIGVGLRPNEGLKMVLGFDSTGSPSQVSGELKLILINKDASGTPIILLGSAEGSHIEYKSLALMGGVALHSDAGAVLFVETELKEAKIVIKAGEGDGFLQKVLPPDGLTANFDLAVGLSTRQGVYFRGSAGLEISLPTHISLGPVELENITLALKVQPDLIPIEAGVTVRATLGPMQAVVENIGLRANFAIKGDNSGNLGMLDFSLGFKPPNGVGLSIDAGAVKGGGYLFFDFDKEEYAGALELTISGFISAKAIGLITTKMPDGSKGFSMLIILTAEFMPPFQLGYGFTLIGVGGLLGLNRTVLVEPLREGVRNGAVNNILFPQNVVANAPRIISDLRTIFPPYANRFLVGPMGKLGWGTPTLVSLTMGLIIEIPGNIAILGVLRIALPDENISIVKIQVAFVGIIDFGKQMLSFDASLFDSRILFMTLEGDMAVRLKWGDDPDFILTVGGFHPSYKPPPLALPSLRRIAINIIDTDVARIRVECYQAITSNTVQFGAHADLFFGFSDFSVTGHIGFDALFQFSPFYFIVEVSASVSMKAFGVGVFSIHLRFTLEGPTPWRAKGKGTLSLFFFDISADFDKTWGESKNSSLPDIAILILFLEEIAKKEQWNAEIPDHQKLLVSLRKLDEGSIKLVLHPAGRMIVRQKMVPLTIEIEKIGNRKTSDVKKISITTGDSGGTPLQLNPVDESFARAQYQSLSDADKLSKPSFEKMPGGVSLSMGIANVKAGKLVRRKIAYEVIIIDREPKKPLPFGGFFIQLGLLFGVFLRGSSVSKSVLSQSYQKQRKPFGEKMEVKEQSYTVAFTANNKAYSESASFNSEAAAADYLKEQVRSNPNLKKELHVLPKYELN
jgi:hypothetical protein